MDSIFVPDTVMNFILLLAEYYIYISKLRETVPSVQGFKYNVKQKYATEEYKK